MRNLHAADGQKKWRVQVHAIIKLIEVESGRVPGVLIISVYIPLCFESLANKGLHLMTYFSKIC